MSVHTIHAMRIIQVTLVPLIWSFYLLHRSNFTFIFRCLKKFEIKTWNSVYPSKQRLFALEDNSEELNPLKRQLPVIYDGDTFMTVELFATYFTTGQIPLICQVHKTHSGGSIAHIQRRILYFQASQVVWCLDL